jgi:general secretion pathway protein E
MVADMEDAADTKTPASLSQRIAQARAAGMEDVLSILRSQAPDPQLLVDELGALLGMPVPRMHALSEWSPQFPRMSFSECARRRCALLHAETGQQQFVITDPFDTDMVAWARSRFGALDVALVSAETFDAWLAHCEAGLSAMESVSLGVDATKPMAAVQLSGAKMLSLREMGNDDSPAVRFVNSTLYDALKAGASDVHLEGDPSGLAVKFRLDGVLTALRRVDSPELAAQTISRIKVMAQLDIAEGRVPQDGRLQILYAGRAIDVRVSIMPSIHGEDAVLRILDRQHLAESLAGLSLAKLGFDQGAAETIRRLCKKPHGMFLVTGPTGSGKTTTLYAAITETHQSRDKVITIEDPVEYQLAGVLQIPVNERKGLTFARGLRSILRHDPDKILVGEIRDAETAQIAVHAALTGHLVFTTVHANSAFDVVGRFSQFGIDAYTFGSAINGILAQRLVRRVCPHCAISICMTAELPIAPGLDDAARRSREQPRLFQAQGCEQCRGTGYAGRFAIGELLSLTPPLKGLIAAHAPLDQVQAEAERGGWRGMRDLALDAAVQGETTLEEVDRVAA